MACVLKTNHCGNLLNGQVSLNKEFTGSLKPFLFKVSKNRIVKYRFK